MTTLPKLTEAAFQRMVKGLAEGLQYEVLHFNDSRTATSAGWVDLVITHKNTLYMIFVELKTEIGRVSQAQEFYHDALRLGGHRVYVWRPSDLANGTIEQELLKGVGQ